MDGIKFFSIILACLVILNFILFAMGKISISFFWLIIAICGIFTYIIIPKLKK